MTGRPRALTYWLAAGFVAGIIFVLMLAPPGTAPTPRVQPPFVGLDKWLHVVDYAVLAISVVAAMRASSLPQPVARSWVAVSLYSTLLEGLQWFVPYRLFSLGDVAANLIGAGLGVGIWYGIVAFRSAAVFTR